MSRTPGKRFDRTPEKTARSRRLRVQTTDAERKLWSILRSGQMEGVSFRRQHPMGPYILDFYAPAIGLVIEADGGQHSDRKHAASDTRRARWLGERGIAVIRFWNSDIFENIDGVAEAIGMNLKARRGDPLPSSPFQGEGVSVAAATSPLPPERGRMGGGQQR